MFDNSFLGYSLNDLKTSKISPDFKTDAVTQQFAHNLETQKIMLDRITALEKEVKLLKEHSQKEVDNND